MATTTRLAVATLWDGTERFRCGFPLWCRSARRFGETSGLHTSIVILKPAGLSVQGCPGAHSHWPEDVAAALQGYVERHRWLWYVHHYWRSLLKLAIFALTDFDAVLFTDLDVDVHSRWQPKSDRWRMRLRSFLHDPDVFFAAAPDGASPINAGVLLAKPRRWLHEDNLEVLRGKLTFNRRDGFNSVGRPRTLGINMPRLAAGSFGRGKRALASLGSLLNGTTAYRKDDWSFVGASIDQGLFWYLFYVRADRGLLTANPGRRGHTLEHYWGGVKPWRPGGQGRPDVASRYLWRLVPSDERSEDNCSRELFRMKTRLQRRGVWRNRTTNPRSGLGALARHVWLPLSAQPARRVQRPSGRP